MSRIDVHHHLLPPPYTRWLRGHGIHQAGGRELLEWSPERSLALMDAQRIGSAVLSLSTPGVHLGDDKGARAIARQVNDYAAARVADHPDRFGFFATLPLPDLDGALAEAEYALDELAADGVALLANAAGTYLGDPVYEPLMALLDERAAVVHVHPAELPAPPMSGLPPYAADFLLDTTRAAMNLVLHDVPRRHPNLRIILAHGGGFLPYAAHRIAVALSGQTGRDRADLLADLSSFFFDTALTSSPTALPSLLAFARPGHVLYGSDWPFAPDPAVSYFTALLEEHDPLPVADQDRIDSGDARALFPRLAKEQP
ncbi:amidohydrolase family protein [Streptomyces sp. HD1123-B1]|uniref:amidohydrolase family protein n=1 Tax=Streptomyces huangiella TaxID=3228804 RepID=UPI003D7D20B8